MLRTKLHQFIQIAVCAHYVAWFTILSPLMLILLAVSLISPLCPLALAYLAWCYYDRQTPKRGGRRSTNMRNHAMWRYFVDYFPMRLHKTVDIDPSKGCYIFVHHPHNCLGMANTANFGTDVTGANSLFPGLTFSPLTLDIVFWIPIMREIAMSIGTSSVSAECMEYKMTKMGPGQAVADVVGGTAEEGLTDPNDPYRLALKDRKGFVRMALKTGASLVPVFSFGEAGAFTVLNPRPGSILNRFQHWVHRVFAFYPLIFYGYFILVPHRTPIDTVVGAPIEVPLRKDPTKEEIDHYHSIYVDALKKLFDENVAKYGDPSKSLKIL